MSSLILSWFLLAAGLLFCLGLALGTTWAIHAMQPRLRHLAERRRKLNEEWLALRAASNPKWTCPRCGYVITEQIWYVTPRSTDDPEEED